MDNTDQGLTVHQMQSNIAKPVLETTGINRPPALRGHCSDTTILLKST